MGCFAFGLADRTPSGDSAQITLTEVKPAPQREVLATVRFSPASAADGASWVREIAWQGGGLVGAPLERVGEGVYRTPEPLPVYGKWKAALRIENGHTLLGVGIYAPADAAIPVGRRAGAGELHPPAAPGSRAAPARAKARHPRLGFGKGASLMVLVLALAFLTVLAIALARYSRGPRRAHRSHRSRPSGRRFRPPQGGWRA